MYSRLFDNTAKGTLYADKLECVLNGDKRKVQLTICELHRQIYDLLIVNGNEKVIRAVVPVLEKAYLAGLKMNKKMVENKIGELEWDIGHNSKEILELRNMRIDMIRQIDEAGNSI